MKARQLDPERYYEITAVEPDHIWYATPGGDFDIVGVVIQQDPDAEPNGIYLRIKKPSANGFPTTEQVGMFRKGLTFRPLSIKEQEKIDGLR